MGITGLGAECSNKTPSMEMGFFLRIRLYNLVFLWRCGSTRAMSFSVVVDSKSHTTTHHTPLGEWSARRRDLCLTTHNTHNRQTSMPSAGFEPTISAGERPQTYALNRAATGTEIRLYNSICKLILFFISIRELPIADYWRKKLACVMYVLLRNNDKHRKASMGHTDR